MDPVTHRLMDSLNVGSASFGWFLVIVIWALLVLCPLAYYFLFKWELQDVDEDTIRHRRLALVIVPLALALFLLLPPSVYSSIEYQPPDPCSVDNGWLWYLLYGCYLG